MNSCQKTIQKPEKINKKITKIIQKTEYNNIRENTKKLQEEGQSANKRWYSKVKGEYKGPTQMDGIKVEENGKVKLETEDEDIENDEEASP